MQDQQLRGLAPPTLPNPGADPSSFLTGLSSSNNSSSGSGTPELSTFVESLLRELQTKFDDMSNQILGKMEAMQSRITELESSIDDLVVAQQQPLAVGVGERREELEQQEHQGQPERQERQRVPASAGGVRRGSGVASASAGASGIGFGEEAAPTAT
ncbi:heat shock factor binding protein 1-domain-containing protein [Zopfochytrium polystomum]|nr:heat shock factor binding protein 1-domain-containing protein [Zopfochytrium polystomum]